MANLCDAMFFKVRKECAFPQLEEVFIESWIITTSTSMGVVY
jgi:hypothetical protein